MSSARKKKKSLQSHMRGLLRNLAQQLILDEEKAVGKVDGLAVSYSCYRQNQSPSIPVFSPCASVAQTSAAGASRLQFLIYLLAT